MFSNFNNLLQTEMTRKQFLITLGLAIGSIFGMEKIIRLVFGNHRTISHQFGTVDKIPTAYGHKTK